MYKFIFSISLLALVACSSSSKDESSELTAKDQAESPSKGLKNRIEAVHSPVLAAPTAPSSSSNQALLDALKNRDDELVYKIATQKLSVSSQDLNALNAMGLYHLRKGRPFAAKLFFNKIVLIKPSSSEAYANIGLANLALKENKDAIYAFKKAVEFDANNVAAGMNLGSLYLAGRDFHKAYSILSLIESKAIRDIVFLNNFAVASAAYGKTEEAETLYREALKNNSSHKELLYNYAIFQIDYLKKYKDGLETLDRLKLLGLGENMKNYTNALENRAKTGLK